MPLHETKLSHSNAYGLMTNVSQDKSKTTLKWYMRTPNTESGELTSNVVECMRVESIHSKVENRVKVLCFDVNFNLYLYFSIVSMKLC